MFSRAPLYRGFRMVVRHGMRIAKFIDSYKWGGSPFSIDTLRLVNNQFEPNSNKKEADNT